jgi:hypothetical protein
MCVDPTQSSRREPRPMRRALLAALAALALSACGNAVANPSPPATVMPVNPPIAAITEGVKQYLSQQNIAKVSESQVDVEVVVEGAARARVYPEDPNSTDPAWVFLKQNEWGLWTVVAGPGTAFSPADMQAAGLPESLLPTTP